MKKVMKYMMLLLTVGLLGLSVHASAAPEVMSAASAATEVVDADTLISGKFMELSESVSDNCCSEVSDMEGLCNVGGGIVKNYRLSLSFIARAVPFALFENFSEDVLTEKIIIDKHVEVSVY